MPLIRHGGLLVLGLIVVGALVWGFWPRPVLVDAQAAKAGPMTVTVDEEGKTRVTDRFVISAPVAGYMQRLTLEVGDGIEPGQVLTVLEPLRSEAPDPRRRAEAQAQVEAARAALQAARQHAESTTAEADYAAAELARTQDLFASNNASQDALDRAQADVRSARAQARSAAFQVKVARHQLQAAQTALQYAGVQPGGDTDTVAVRSPVVGNVLAIHHKSEGVVRAGEPLLEVGDPRSLEVEVEVLSRDAVRIAPGSSVRLDQWGGEQLLEGVVRTIEPVGFTKISALGVEEQRVRVIADLSSPARDWRRLGDGYRVEARFILWEGDDVLQIPASALFRHKQGWAVFVIEEGRARRRAVEVGHRTGLAAQVMAGIDPGETVITHPDDAIDDGVRVKMHGEGAEPLRGVTGS